MSFSLKSTAGKIYKITFSWFNWLSQGQIRTTFELQQGVIHSPLLQFQLEGNWEPSGEVGLLNPVNNFNDPLLITIHRCTFDSKVTWNLVTRLGWKMLLRPQWGMNHQPFYSKSNVLTHWVTKEALQRCSYENVFWKYAATLQENTHAEQLQNTLFWSHSP